MFPSLIGERIVMGCGYVVFSALVAGLGTLSVAAHSIGATIEQAFMCQMAVFKLQSVHTCWKCCRGKRRIRIRIGCTSRTYCGCFYYDSNGHRSFCGAEVIICFFTKDEQVIVLECHY